MYKILSKLAQVLVSLLIIGMFAIIQISFNHY
jgi:hypothetical protein